ncbi:6-phosphogluconolactonase [Nocardioides sp.]|uniref:6-phosphogluconolactonase n=1 Tax=Nocardioides sp. TaxID=35761 RepID=UPI0027326F97|nr:6-phosphogluconolactonase [Nocardioides sp.]MDP3893788.1 6-phosphogluconolactonase [Nocardioides sp.]
MTPQIEVHPDGESLATIVAARLLDLLADRQAAGLVPSIALTGGSIADVIHREIARLTPVSGVDWSNVDIWWGDERFVAADSPDRNAGQARAAFLTEVGATGWRVHEVPADQGQGVDAAAAAYDQEVREHGGDGVDVMMLGVGPDGHVASLFPGFAQLDVDDRLAVAVTNSPKPPPERVSLTFGALNNAREVWFLVSGDGKADAVAAALAGVVDHRPAADLHETPAAGVSGTETTVWFLDEAAASRLP